MIDVIRLLPDAIANQIAAGEVIQRPASVVKELLENAVDAGSTKIKLVIKDAGKTLIQVIDDGCGMSETDARMCFERHATSKIRYAKDLFSIRTMGFRGEAMASIAAIAHVELRSRRRTDEIGTKIIIEGSEVKSQAPCQCSEGTKIAVKNLFYNVPARRNFLKSNTVEMRHILDEFQRVALAHPDLFFSLHHNGTEMFHLQPGNLRQRVVGILGANVNKKLVPVKEETDILNIRGFVGKAEFAKKSRGEQFFFVNDRFIKSGYLSHAVMSAYEDLLPKGAHPFYVLFIEMDPARIDINVHPTKQEIKFDDERLVYNYLKVTVRHALAQYNVTPTLDFEAEPAFNPVTPRYPKPNKKKDGKSKDKSHSSPIIKPDRRHRNNLKNWQKLYDGLDMDSSSEDQKEEHVQPGAITIESKVSSEQDLSGEKKAFSKESKKPYQIHNTYIISQIASGFLLIDQQAAHERILYEKYLAILESQQPSIQKELFPKNIKLPPADAILLKEMLPHLNLLGLDVREFGQDTFVLHGIPAGLKSNLPEQELIELLIEQYRRNVDLKTGLNEGIARSMAYSAAIKRGHPLKKEEMREIIDQLFACSIPFKGPRGNHCFVTYSLEELSKRFGG